MYLREGEWSNKDWTDVAHGRNQWRALVNTVINLGVLQNLGKLFSS
jgi:hypothetical protein